MFYIEFHTQKGFFVMLRQKFISAALICFLIFSFLFSGCLRQDEKITKSGFFFNTIISVTIYDASKEALLEECFSMAKTYENYFSPTIPDSDISKINAAAGTPVEVHEETVFLIQKGMAYGELSRGKFDITIGKLSNLWNFSAKSLIDASEESILSPPKDDDIKSALSAVDYKNIVIDGNHVTLADPNAAIDLGGIAKGYIADRMKEFLNQNGVTSGFINLGGNVLALGPKSDGGAYTIGIQYPFRETGSAIASVRISDETVVSSGIYERCFEYEGTFYHHILDTETGYPCENNLLGVTVITKNSVDGDGLSTTCFSLGLEDGMTLIESIPDTEAIFITDDYELHTSSGIGNSVPFQKL